MKKYHDIREIKFQDDCMILKIDGEEKCFKLKEVSFILANATKEQRNKFKVSPSGYGIHWPLLDEDISIDALLANTSATKQHKQDGKAANF